MKGERNKAVKQAKAAEKMEEEGNGKKERRNGEKKK